MSSVWLAYADDSGNEEFSLHSALLIPIERWSDALEMWRLYRLALQRTQKVPREWELHASNWIMGKDNPAPAGAPINHVVGRRREWSQNALKAIAAMPDIQVFTVVSQTPIKADAYREFVLQLDMEMRSYGDRALLVMDGNPRDPDPHVQQTHRELTLKTRHVIEDGWVQDSSQSQFIQMADLLAHCAFQHHERNPDRQFMWDWYASLVHDVEWECACRKDGQS